MFCKVCAAKVECWENGRIDGEAPRHKSLCLVCRIVFRKIGILEEIAA